jgi:hypothetical protein
MDEWLRQTNHVPTLRPQRRVLRVFRQLTCAYTVRAMLRNDLFPIPISVLPA